MQRETSYLHNLTVQSFKTFEWKEVLRELHERAPVLTLHNSHHVLPRIYQ